MHRRAVRPLVPRHERFRPLRCTVEPKPAKPVEQNLERRLGTGMRKDFGPRTRVVLDETEVHSPPRAAAPGGRWRREGSGAAASAQPAPGGPRRGRSAPPPRCGAPGRRPRGRAGAGPPLSTKRERASSQYGYGTDQSSCRSFYLPSFRAGSEKTNNVWPEKRQTQRATRINVARPVRRHRRRNKTGDGLMTKSTDRPIN